MASNTKKTALQRLTPNSIVATINGKEVQVAADAGENTILNAIMVARGRTFLHATLKHYEDLDDAPSPRELKDLLSAMQNLVETSNVVYATAEPINDRKPSERHADKPDDSIDFSNLHKLPTVEGSPPEAGGAGFVSGVQGEASG
jgi:hypothetical protein